MHKQLHTFANAHTQSLVENFLNFTPNISLGSVCYRGDPFHNPCALNQGFSTGYVNII